MAEFASPSDLAPEIGLTAATVRLLCQRGDIPGARKLGGRWVIHRPTFAASFGQPAPREAPARRPTLLRGTLARICDTV